jgi:hypothetical protein
MNLCRLCMDLFHQFLQGQLQRNSGSRFMLKSLRLLLLQSKKTDYLPHLLLWILMDPFCFSSSPTGVSYVCIAVCTTTCFLGQMCQTFSQRLSSGPYCRSAWLGQCIWQYSNHSLGFFGSCIMMSYLTNLNRCELRDCL